MLASPWPTVWTCILRPPTSTITPGAGFAARSLAVMAMSVTFITPRSSTSTNTATPSARTNRRFFRELPEFVASSFSVTSLRGASPLSASDTIPLPFVVGHRRFLGLLIRTGEHQMLMSLDKAFPVHAHQAMPIRPSSRSDAMTIRRHPALRFMT